jgi:MFS family permease
LNAIQNVGQLVSLPFCAFACDYFGRKKTLGFGACIILLGTGLQGGAQNSEFEICHCKPKNAI